MSVLNVMHEDNSFQNLVKYFIASGDASYLTNLKNQYEDLFNSTLKKIQSGFVSYSSFESIEKIFEIIALPDSQNIPFHTLMIVCARYGSVNFFNRLMALPNAPKWSNENFSNKIWDQFTKNLTVTVAEFLYFQSVFYRNYEMINYFFEFVRKSNIVYCYLFIKYLIEKPESEKNVGYCMHDRIKIENPRNTQKEMLIFYNKKLYQDNYKEKSWYSVPVDLRCFLEINIY